ncbi:MAG: group II intron reverse transcriptase/maturase [Chloroflexota bacterium]|nr:group II intron reverse transcriptase/maturase [Chloroflexota bacterium]
MTAEVVKSAGAVSHKAIQLDDWHSINWPKAHQQVRRLQTRIMKAAQAGKWGKVKALQHLLTHSFSGKVLAVKRVTENQGKLTPGADKVLWETPNKKAAAVNSLKQHGYQPSPLRRVFIPKRNGKLRPLGILTMKDRAMQSLYLLALDPIVEMKGDKNSYGFRRGRSCADAIEQCFSMLAHSYDATWVLEGDIKSCYDKISHDWLLANIPLNKAILRKWLKAGVMEKLVLKPTEEGTVQGGPISPALANLTLDGLETKLREKFPPTNVAGKGHRAKYKVNFIRFADDFIITGRSSELLEQEVQPLVEGFLQERGLELSKEKTKITDINTGFDFLGQNVRKYKGKLLIKPSKNNVHIFLTKIREKIKSNKQTTTGKLISQLNPMIIGWANYHQHVVSKAIYHKVDHAIFQSLWQWAKRRHPNKGKKWVKKKYFHSQGNRNWVFSGKVAGKDGKYRLIQLLKASDVPIKRHTKIRGEANPYDPAWESYFERRQDLKMENDLKGRRKLLYLWKEQNGICPVCQQKITKLSGWHSHHLVWRVNGGEDKAVNRVLLHPNCHRQVHNCPEITVVKPRSPTKER